MTTFDFEKAKAELPFLRAFIDFVNRQVGVYRDCLASFDGNRVRVERRIPRARHPVGHRIENGRPVIVYASVEDLTSPAVIHHRIIRADEFISANSEVGFNEQQPCWSIIVLVKQATFTSLLKAMGMRIVVAPLSSAKPARRQQLKVA